MYAWIWRHLPFGLPGKIIGSLVLIGAAVAALWFWVFPAGWVQDLVPGYDSTIETGTGGSGPAPAVGPSEPASSPSPSIGSDGQPPGEQGNPNETGE